MRRIVLVLGTALISMIAFVLTQARCGTVNVGAPASESSYCRALGAPGISPQPVGVLILVVLFVVPFGGTLAIALMPARRGRRTLRWLGFAALVIVGASFALLLVVHASYLAD